MNAESQITVVTLYGALWPLALPWLPCAVIVAVPARHDPTMVDLHVRWLDAQTASTSLASPASLLSSYPWRTRVEFALARATTFEECVQWWQEAANGVTMDLSVVVEIVDVEDLDLGELADVEAADGQILAMLEDGLFAEHVMLRAEVEALSALAS